jgi:8-oxo-dGTP pyrophosphatase MutT (NUDIX family)
MNRWSLIGGIIQNQESSEDGLIRLVQQELGITLSGNDLFYRDFYEDPELGIYGKRFYYINSYRGEVLAPNITSSLNWFIPGEETSSIPMLPIDQLVLEKLSKNVIFFQEANLPRI